MGLLTVGCFHLGNKDDISLTTQKAIDSADLLVIENNIDHRFGYKTMLEDNLEVFFNNNTNKNRIIIQYGTKMLDLLPEVELFKKYLQDGRNVVVLSDEGSPLIDDSGTLSIKIARNLGHDVNFLSGPATPMLVYSNAFKFILDFPNLVDGFCFIAARSDDEESLSKVRKALDAGISVVLNFTQTWENSRLDLLFGNRKVILCLDLTLETEKVWISQLSKVSKYTSDGGVLSMLILPDIV
jgi:16S rRNA C1402 (ribose-2'-O) methylase RsmI